MKRIRTALILMLMALMTAPLAMAAPTTEVVTEADVTRQVESTPPTDSWVLYTRAGTLPTAGAFVNGPEDPPLGNGSLQLTTATGSEKVYLFNFEHIGTKLSDIDNISYATYRTAGSAQQVAALNAVIDFNGPDVAGGFTTLVFEPVYNTDQGAVVSGEWQDWTATGSGVWWSTRAINGQCAGATDTCDKTWAEIVANNPDATILGGVGVNQGGGNAGLISNVDAFTFNETTYDFELIRDTDGDGVADGDDNCPANANSDQLDTDSDGEGNVCDSDDDGDGVSDDQDGSPTTAGPVTKDECKNGRWALFTNPSFKNQGDCIQYVNTGK